MLEKIEKKNTKKLAMLERHSSYTPESPLL